jgi:hypothetical protein
MKKITFLLILILAWSFSNGAIIVRDITDFTFTTDASLEFDFNNDGTAEFTFSESGGTVGAMFDPDAVNFVTYGTFDDGEGWDVIKSLSLGSAVNSSCVYGALGDAYINPFWATTGQMFPSGDSYIGTTFKIGNFKYYGWILVNVTNDVVIVKKYAYNNLAEQPIATGQTTGIETNESLEFVTIYPNPTQDFVSINQPEMIKSVAIYAITGQKLFESFDVQQNISLQNFPKGTYLFTMETISGGQISKKVVKK